MVLLLDSTALDWAPPAGGTSGVAVEITGSEAAGASAEDDATTSAAELEARIDEAASAAEEAITEAWSGGTGVPTGLPHSIICIIVIVETWVTVIAGATL